MVNDRLILEAKKAAEAMAENGNKFSASGERGNAEVMWKVANLLTQLAQALEEKQPNNVG